MVNIQELPAAQTTGPRLVQSLQGIHWQDSTDSKGRSLGCGSGSSTGCAQGSEPCGDPSHSRQRPPPACSCDADADCALSSLWCVLAPKRWCLWVITEREWGCVTRFASWHWAPSPPLLVWAPTRLVSTTHRDQSRSRRGAMAPLSLSL